MGTVAGVRLRLRREAGVDAIETRALPPQIHPEDHHGGTDRAVRRTKVDARRHKKLVRAHAGASQAQNCDRTGGGPGGNGCVNLRRCSYRQIRRHRSVKQHIGGAGKIGSVDDDAFARGPSPGTEVNDERSRADHDEIIDADSGP